MSTSIHPTAIVNAKAELGADVSIGPFCVIDGDVTIGRGCKLYQGVYVTGWTEIGDDCVLHPHVIVGHEPQDTKYAGERTFCRIGRRTILRENVSIHRGTTPETTTVVGEDCFLLGGSHVAHNCTVGNHVTLINNAMLAGHVTIGDRCTLGGGTGVHQFVRIGELAMVRGNARVPMDVVPFAMIDSTGKIAGINRVGVRRSSLDQSALEQIRNAYRVLFERGGGSFESGVHQLQEIAKSEVEHKILAFVKETSKRGLAGMSRGRSE